MSTRLSAAHPFAWHARVRAGLVVLCGLLAALVLPAAAHAAPAAAHAAPAAAPAARAARVTRAARAARVTRVARVTRAATKVVRYDGWHARVPASWPVYHLGVDSRTCVRFNRHAVYLGRPGAAQRCPAHAVGRTEAILVTPRTGALSADAIGPGASAAARAADPSAGAAAQVQRHAARILVTATWGRDPAAVRSALGVRSVTAAGRAYARRQATVEARTTPGDDAVAHTGGVAPVAPVATVAPETPGAVFTGLGFDACSAPSQTAMTAWAVSSPFHAVGVYIGGANMACSQPNLTAAWVSAQAAAGWHLIPTYVGLQAPGNGCGCAAISTTDAAAQGTEAAQSAVLEAQSLGLSTGNPIYYDMENYTRTTTASETVLTFLGAWTTALHEAGYSSGVYSSELSGIEDLVAQQGTGYDEPDDIWTANWNGQQTTTDAAIPVTEWGANQRLHQYLGGHTDDYGGASISVDSDYLNGATAAPGAVTVTSTIASAPTVAVSPQPNGTIRVAPSWQGESGVSSWVISAGSSPTTLTDVASVSASHATYVSPDADPDFEVEALNAAGQELGVSGTVPTPSYVAIFGHTAFVARSGPGGLPVQCDQISACRVSTTIVLGHRTIARIGLQRVPAGGGSIHFPLSTAAHKLVNDAGNAGLTVTITVHSSTGRSATRTMKLVRFTATGAGPRRLAGSGTAMRILGVTDFVSHGWTGGILVACRQTTPCTATPTVSLAGTALATAAAQTIGAGQIGYLSFRMTAAGHARLMHALGNQLGVGVRVTGAATGLQAASTAHALIALDAF